MRSPWIVAVPEASPTTPFSVENVELALDVDVPGAPGKTDYSYGYGGQACRMALVEYLMRARSPHSNGLKEPGDLEWVRVYEVDPQIHCVVRAEARRSGTDVEYSGGLTDTAL